MSMPRRPVKVGAWGRARTTSVIIPDFGELLTNTPDEHDGQEYGNESGFPLKKTCLVLFGFVIVTLVLVGYDSEALGTFVAAAGLYLAQNAPATMRAKVKKFLAESIEVLYGCRTCQA